MEEQVLPDNEGVSETVSADEAERVEMGAIWDKANAEGFEEKPTVEEQPRGPDGKFVAKEPAEEDPVEVEEVAAEIVTPEGDKTAETATPEADETETVPGTVATSEAPSFLSYGIKQNWEKIPAEVQEAITADHKEYSDKMADQGRQLTAIQPIADQVVKAAQSIPGMRDMTPAQIAADVFNLAQIQAEMQQNPVETILKVANQYGALQGIKARLEGQQLPDNTSNVVNELRQMRQENERLREQMSPERIHDMMNQTLTQRDSQTRITEFASTREHYAQIESDLPVFIPAARQILGESASEMDILSRSYDMAINARGLKATETDLAPKPVPKQAELAVKAKSVNVTSRSTGTAKPLTERELMGKVWDRHMAS